MTLYLKYVLAIFVFSSENFYMGTKWHGKAGELQGMRSNHEHQQLEAKVLEFLVSRVPVKHTRKEFIARLFGLNLEKNKIMPSLNWLM